MGKQSDNVPAQEKDASILTSRIKRLEVQLKNAQDMSALYRKKLIRINWQCARLRDGLQCVSDADFVTSIFDQSRLNDNASNCNEFDSFMERLKVVRVFISRLHGDTTNREVALLYTSHVMRGIGLAVYGADYVLPPL
jgi:hypothetical protein